MRARTIELYLLPSLTQVIGSDQLVLIDAPGRRASLTKAHDEAALHIRRRNVSGALITSSLIGSDRPAGQTPRERFDTIFAGPAGQLADTKEGMLLVIDCEEDIADRDLDHTIDLGDFALSLDAEAGTSFGDTARQVRHTALTALALTGFEGVAHDGRVLGIANMIIATGSERPTYVVTPQASFTISSKSSLLPDQAIEAVKLAHALDKAPKNLRHIPRLLAQSHENRLQPLNAFISAWAGLEILIGATFEQYEAAWTTAISRALPPSAKNVAGRMRTVMKDKYRLADKFAIMASALDPAGSDQDIAAFNELKGVRDAFFHTLSHNPDQLPGEATRRLLRKYLSLHLTQI